MGNDQSNIFSNTVWKDTFSEESLDAAKTVYGLLIKFTGPLSEVNPLLLFDSVRALAKLQETVREQPIPLKDSEVVHPTPDTSFTVAKYYMGYAVAAYGHTLPKLLGITSLNAGGEWTDEGAIRELTPVSSDTDIISSEFGGDLYHPGYFIALDRNKCEVIVSIRGTYRPKDLITDVVMEETPFVCRLPRVATISDSILQTENPSLKRVSWRSKASETTNELGLALTEEEILENTTGIIGSFGNGFMSTLNPLFDWVDNISSFISTTSDIPPNVLDNSAESIRNIKLRDEAEETDTMEEVEFIELHGKTHSGWLRAAYNLDKSISGTVKMAMVDNPGYRLVLTGHSMGATISTLLTLMWAEREYFSSARCYAFASPGSLTLDLAKHPMVMDRVTSVTLGNDFVSRFGLPNLFDLRQSLIRLAKCDPEDPKGRTYSQVILSGLADKRRLERIMSTLETEEMIHEKLYPAGTIWYTMPYGVDVNTRGVRVGQEYFGEMLLTMDMFVTHFGSLITLSKLGGCIISVP